MLPPLDAASSISMLRARASDQLSVPWWSQGPGGLPIFACFCTQAVGVNRRILRFCFVGSAQAVKVCFRGVPGRLRVANILVAFPSIARCSGIGLQ
jgi:hypothetical protein